MKNVKILGTGCANCQTTTQLIKAIAKEKGVEVEIEKIEDIQIMMTYGIMRTPAVVIDNKVVHSGGIPERAVIASWFR